MTNRQFLDWLASLEFFGIKLGLDQTRALFLAAGSPERGLRFIHVTGSNGKGSVCAMLESILREAGYKTGLYTSPHIWDYTERIKVSGVEISKNNLNIEKKIITSIKNKFNSPKIKIDFSI